MCLGRVILDVGAKNFPAENFVKLCDRVRLKARMVWVCGQEFQCLFELFNEPLARAIRFDRLDLCLGFIR